MLFLNNELNEIQENIELLDILYEYDIITANEYDIGKFVRNSYRKQKDFDMSVKYKERTTGGKIKQDFDYIVEVNKDWNLIKNNTEERDIKYLEAFIGENTKIKDFIKVKKYEKIVKIIIKILSYLLLKFKDKKKLTLVDNIDIIKYLISKYGGYKKISNDLKISRHQISEVVFLRNFKYKTYEKLLNYFNLK